MASAVLNYSSLIQEAARARKIPASILAGLVQVESAGNPDAVSGAGAFGSTQFMPGTAKSYGVQRGSSPAAVRSQIMGAAKYLVDLGYHQRPDFALAAYNGGPGNPQYGYAEQVKKAAHEFRGLDKAPVPRGQALRSAGGQTVNATATASVPVTVDVGGGGIAAAVAQQLEASRRPPVQATAPPPPAVMAGQVGAGSPGVGALPASVPVSPTHGDIPLSALMSQASQGAQSISVPVTADGDGQARVPSHTPQKTRGTQIAAGGGYSGTQGIAESMLGVARRHGLAAGSTKRTPQHNAEVGGSPTSDHLTTRTDAYAIDLPTSNGLAAAQDIAKFYGVKFRPNSYDSGGTIAVGGHRYKVQILWGGAIDHSDHVHVGVTRLG